MTQVYPAVTQLSQHGFPLTLVCELLSVCRSAYYTWRQDSASARQQEDSRLMPIIANIFWRHKRRYGARRISKELKKKKNEHCGPKRVARLMKAMNLVSIQPKSFRPRTTNSCHTLGYSPNLLLEADEPLQMNRLWVGDITYLPLKKAEFAYAALLMDRCSRRIVGWKIETHMQETLALAALRQALRVRQPQSGLIHHSDRGGQYAGTKYRQTLKRFGVQQSMSRAANCYDNAFMESCFGTIKTELEMERYGNVTIARKELEAYIRYYNTRRLHSSLDYSTPLEFEENLREVERKSVRPKRSRRPMRL